MPQVWRARGVQSGWSLLPKSVSEEGLVGILRAGG